MRAVVFEAQGGVDQLKLAELPDPATMPGQVRVRIKAVAVNRLDIWVREGWRGLKLEMPHILGSDIAGVVDEVGQGVTGIERGAEVVLGPGTACGRCIECLSGRDNRCPKYAILGEHTKGGYAELLSVPARNVFAKPAGLSFEETACLPLVFTTAWGMLVERAGIRAGDWVLVHAAGSGVGSAAIQVAKLMGATVIATASTDEKLERAKMLGADHVINYAKESFRTKTKELTNKRGVDIVFEHTGGDTFNDSLLSLATGGKLVTCGATSKPTVEIDIRYLFARHVSIIGNTMGSLAAMIPILEHVCAGKLRPVLDRVLPLEKAREAHEVLRERAQFGKVVLTP
jgi:NADPH:quinone reductase-like Zn-dependent oxidoreductase